MYDLYLCSLFVRLLSYLFVWPIPCFRGRRPGIEGSRLVVEDFTLNPKQGLLLTISGLGSKVRG